MDREKAKGVLGILACVLCWLAAAFFAFLEWAAASWFLELLPDVIHYGYDEAAGYNLYLAENFWEARVFMVVAGIPLVLMLGLAVHFTIKLRKRGKQCGHTMPDKW